MGNPYQPLQRVFCKLVLLLALLLLAGCGSSKVKGESPFVQVGGWRTDGNTLSIDLRLRNVNDEALTVDSVELRATVNEDTPLVQLNQVIGVGIPAGGFETVSLQTTATGAGLALLQALSSGQRASLAYRLEGAVNSPDEGSLRFRTDGRIYRVPGRPGEFR